MRRRYQPRPQRRTIPDFPLDPNTERPVRVELVYQPRPNPWQTPAVNPHLGADYPRALPSEPVDAQHAPSPSPSASLDESHDASQLPDTTENLRSTTQVLSRALDFLAKTGDATACTEGTERACTERSERACTEQSERTPSKSAKRAKSLRRGRKSAPRRNPQGRRARPARPERSRGKSAMADRSVANPDSLSHHSRHCTICRHPDREAIEEDFVHWHPPRRIAHEYDVNVRAVYRHARAAGLFSLRDRKLRFALGHIVERAMDVTPTADSIIRAVHAYARVNDSGQWIEPPAHVIVSSGAAVRSDRPVEVIPRVPSQEHAALPSPLASDAASLPVTACRVESDATH